MKFKMPYKMITPYKDQVICKKDFYEKNEKNGHQLIFKKDYIYRVTITPFPYSFLDEELEKEYNIWDTRMTQVIFWANTGTLGSYWKNRNFNEYFYSLEETKNMLRVELIDKMIEDKHD